MSQSYAACLNLIGWLCGITCKQRLTCPALVHNFTPDGTCNPVYHSLSNWKTTSSCNPKHSITKLLAIQGSLVLVVLSLISWLSTITLSLPKDIPYIYNNITVQHLEMYSLSTMRCGQVDIAINHEMEPRMWQTIHTGLPHSLNGSQPPTHLQ